MSEESKEVTKLADLQIERPGGTVQRPAYLDKYQEDAGKGLSKRAEDNLIPFVYVLQALSPQVQRRSSEYIEGAEAGCFWLRNAREPICSGESGLLVQPCYFTIDWREWKQRDSGGGLINIHPVPKGAIPEICPVPDARQTRDAKNPEKIIYLRPNGNELIFTRTYACRIFTQTGVLPYLMAFTSTGHRTAKSWMALANSLSKSIYEGRYRLKTRERTNAAGTWFVVEVAFEDYVSESEYLEGKALYEAFASGEKQAEEPVYASEDDIVPAARVAERQDKGKALEDEIPF